MSCGCPSVSPLLSDASVRGSSTGVPNRRKWVPIAAHGLSDADSHWLSYGCPLVSYGRPRALLCVWIGIPSSSLGLYDVWLPIGCSHGLRLVVLCDVSVVFLRFAIRLHWVCPWFQLFGFASNVPVLCCPQWFSNGFPLAMIWRECVAQWSQMCAPLFHKILSRAASIDAPAARPRVCPVSPFFRLVFKNMSVRGPMCLLHMGAI